LSSFYTLDRLSLLLGEEVCGMERISGGRNTSVFRIDTETGGRFVLKHYFRFDSQGRNRFRTELDAVNFLRRNGVCCIPGIVASIPEEDIIIYDYIGGSRIDSKTVTPKDIQIVCDFLAMLDRLKNRPGADTLPPASEACFSIQDVIQNIRFRYDRLVGAVNLDFGGKKMLRFLEHKLLPLFYRLQSEVKETCRILNVSYNTELARNHRTLSPSDFGFHNALRIADGSLVFIDFEYFGWDDPAKTIIDFVLHPAMNLNASLAEKFSRTMTGRYENPDGLKNRLRLLYPLYGIKWSLILLNEFIPVEWERRQRAGSYTSMELKDIQLKQLEKAEKMISRIESTVAQGNLFSQSFLHSSFETEIKSS